MTKRKNITNVKKITSFLVTPKKLLNGVRSSVTIAIGGTIGAKYRIVAKDSESNYFSVDPTYANEPGWNKANSRLELSTLNTFKKYCMVSIPLKSNDETYTFYVEPGEGTVLNEGVASVSNPITKEYLSAKTISFDFDCSVTGVSFNQPTTSLSLIPGRSYKVGSLTDEGRLNARFELTHASSNVNSSVETLSINSDAVSVNEILVDGSFRKIELDNDILTNSDVQFGVDFFNTDNSTKDVHVELDISIAVAPVKGIHFIIDLDQIITTS